MRMRQPEPISPVRDGTDADGRWREALLSGIAAVASDAIVAVDEQQRIVMFNEGAERTFGYRAAEVLGAPLDLLIPESWRAAHHRHVSSFASGPVPARRMAERAPVYALRKSGQEFPAEAAISRVEVDGRTFAAVILRDVSERRRIEEQHQLLAEAGALLASSLDYEVTLERVGNLALCALADWCVVYVLARDGVPVRVSVAAADASARPAVAKLEALPLETHAAVLRELGARGDGPLVVPAGAGAGQPLAPALAGLVQVAGAASLVGVPLVARGALLGAFLFLSTSARRPRDEADLRFATELARLAALAIDNARLYRAARDATRARDEVLGIVAHDLRAPLHGLALNVGKVRRDLTARGMAEVIEAPSRSIEGAVARMDRLIQDLLDVTTIDAGRLEIQRASAPPRYLIEIAVDGAAPGDQGAPGVRAEMPEVLPDVSADEGRILQVLANLIDNALKFTGAGTEVVVGAELRGPSVCFRVGDRGPGIAADQLPHVFERFWRADPRDRRGAGLGLAIAKGIVELHGGELWVESAVGQGTTFFFTLPLARQ